MGAVAQDPAHDFFQTVQLQFHLAATVGEVSELLGGVPASITNFISGPGVEFNENVVMFVAFENVKTAAEDLIRVKILWACEGGIREFGAGESGKVKGAQVLAVGIPGKEVPKVVNAGQVVRMHFPRLRIPGATIAILKFEHATLFERARDDLEGLKIGILRRKRAEGKNATIQSREPVTQFAVERAGEFFESKPQGFFERCAVILGDSFVRDEERKDLGFGQGWDRQLIRRAGIKEAVTAGLVFNRSLQAILHVSYVPQYGAFRDFHLGGKIRGIGVSAAEDALVNDDNPFPRSLAKFGLLRFVHSVSEL